MLARVTVRGFRSAFDVTFSPGPLCALVGEANTGKSNLLLAIRALLDPDAPPFTPEDLAYGSSCIEVEGLLRDGRRVSLEEQHDTPTVLFFPSALRSNLLIPPRTRREEPAHPAVEQIERALTDQIVPRLALIGCVEGWCEHGAGGVVLLIEEPELYLRPQEQRYFYRLLHELGDGGCQVIYSTHSPSFLNVARLNELALVERDPESGTRVVQPRSIAADEDFRVLTEFDAERGELFLARAAILVEGLTEKLALPFVFAALGRDADREAISIVECGGKSNIPLFAGICKAARVPFVAVHDRDAEPGQEPILSEQVLNARIAEVAGKRRTVVLEPDFEGIAGLRGSAHKPERAWRSFGSLTAEDVPEPLARVVRLAVRMARD